VTIILVSSSGWSRLAIVASTIIFNSVSAINYPKDKPSQFNLTEFDITGRKVVELVNDQHQPGTNKAVCNANDKAAGVYFVRHSTGNRVRLNN